MNSGKNLTSGEFAGIYELDTAGTVLYTRFARGDEPFEKRADLIGQNFFEEVAGFENVWDFQRRFKNFVGSRQSAENFLFECRFTDEIVPVRVMMMRARETKETETADIVIIDIRKNGA
jgi:hypothetical protein